MLNALTFFTLLILAANAHAGCPAMGIENATTKILSCSYSDVKPAGVLMEVSLSYSNEFFMGEQSTKNMKTKIFQHSSDKDVCKKIKIGKTYCTKLSQWCPMSGAAPRGARFTVEKLSSDQCNRSK